MQCGGFLVVLCVVGAGLVANAQPAASAYSSVPGALAAINPRVRFKMYI